MASEKRAELKAHQETYGGFLTMLRVGTVIAAVLAAIVVLIIRN